MALLSNLISVVRERIVDTDTVDPRISDSHIIELLNRGARDFATKTESVEKTTSPVLAIGTTGNISVPTDYYSTRAAYDENGNRLTERDRPYIVDKQGNSPSNTPLYFTVFAGILSIAPKPSSSANVTLDYYAYPARFVDKLEQTGLSPEIEDAAVDYAVSEAWLALEDAPAASSSFALYQRKRAEAKLNQEGPPVISDVYSRTTHRWR